MKKKNQINKQTNAHKKSDRKQMFHCLHYKANKMRLSIEFNKIDFNILKTSAHTLRRCFCLHSYVSLMFSTHNAPILNIFFLAASIHTHLSFVSFIWFYFIGISKFFLFF